MRSSLFLTMPFLAAVHAQSSSGTTTTSITTPPYSNPATSYLTQTNSLGVVTGMPEPVTSQPAAVTSQPGLPAAITTQPEVVTIPAGLSSGLNTIYINGTSFIASVGSSTTVVITGGAIATDASLTTGDSAGIQPGSTFAASGSSFGSDSGSRSSASSISAASTTSSTGAAATINAVYGAVVGLGAFAIALV